MNYNKFEYSEDKGRKAIELAPAVGIEVHVIGDVAAMFSTPSGYSQFGEVHEILEALCVAVATEAAIRGGVGVEKFADPIDYVLSNYTPARLQSRMARAAKQKSGE